MKERIETLLKRGMILTLCILTAGFSAAKKKQVITIKQGDPLILLQEKKTAIHDIDYSNLIITDDKDHDYDLPFREWMISQDEDKDKWTKDWEEKDSAECYRAFRDYFNDEIDKGMKLTKIGKDYKVTLRLTKANFGKSPKGGAVVAGLLLGGARSLISTAHASGVLEVRDLKNEEVVLLLSFDDLEGEEGYTQIKRFKGIFENLCEQINEYLEEYKKDYEKKQKELEKQQKKLAKQKK